MIQIFFALTSAVTVHSFSPSNWKVCPLEQLRVPRAWSVGSRYSRQLSSSARGPSLVFTYGMYRDRLPPSGT